MEKKYRSALVVEGGALRGIHTAGVLDVLMRCNIYFPCVIGVSAGALNAFNYISHQTGRSADILLHYIRDERYLNLRNIANRKESAFGFDFMFHGLQAYLPFDYETFNDPAQAFTVVATDVEDGSPIYFRKGECSDIFKAGAASASLPLISPPVELDGHRCIDGGVADPIPFLHAMEESERVVVLLTRHKGFRKRTMPFAEREAAKQLYKASPQMLEAALSANDRYNDTLDLLEQMEDEGKLFVIRPSKEIDISLLERNTESLGKLYREGVQDGEKILHALSEYLGLTNSLLQFEKGGTLNKRKYVIGNYTSADELDDLVSAAAQSGKRLTGDHAHERFMREIRNTLQSAQVRVFSDPYYFAYTGTASASLTVAAEDTALNIPCIPMAYAGLSGDQPAQGELYPVIDKNYRFIGARGKLALVHVDMEVLRGTYRAERVFSVPDDLPLPDTFGVGAKTAAFSFLSLAKVAGAKGVICVWDGDTPLPQALPYAQHDVGIPCVWIGREDGQLLQTLLDTPTQCFASLSVTAQTVPHAETQTVYCVLPGTEAEESVLVHTHTDGINRIEENGFAALLSLIDALKDKPLRRTHIFVFASGRYRLPMMQPASSASTGAISKWLEMHRDLWDGRNGHLRAVAAISAEQLGLADLPEIVFSSNSGIDAVYRQALEQRDDPRSIVLRASGAIFGEGQPVHSAGIPVLAFCAEDALLWSDETQHTRFSSARMLEQTQTILDCLTLLDEMPKEAIGRVEKRAIRDILT